MCLDLQWSLKPLEQIQCLQVAYQAVLSKGIPAGSFARSVLQAACYKVAESLTVQAVREQPHQGELAGLINMLADRMAIQDTQVGSEIEDLKPTAGHAAGGVYDDEQWPSKAFPEGADVFDPDVVAQAVEKITTDKEGSGINTGPSGGGGGGGGGKAVSSAGGKDKEGPGIDAGPSTGSEGDGGGGGGPLPDKTPLPGLGDKEQDPRGGGEEKKEEREPRGDEEEEKSPCGGDEEEKELGEEEGGRL
jgi:hypothetical protein